MVLLGLERSSWIVVGSIGARQSRSKHRSVINATQDSSQAGARPRIYPLPSTLEENIDQARGACKQAMRDGSNRLQLEMPLPLIGATDLDDWPGGIQQRFKAAAPMVLSLLSGIIPVENENSSGGELKKYLIDEGDAVGVWENEKVALVLFPTADALATIQEMVSRKIDRPLIFMNVEWRDGQVISDFGFGGKKKLREDFVKSFSMVYYLQQLRILGDNVKIFKRHPGSWQIFLTDASGESECIAVEPEKPSYEKLRLILKEAKGSSSASNSNWFTRMVQELKFNADSLKNR